MNKSLIIFLVAFPLSTVFSFLPLIVRTVVLPSSIAESISIDVVLNFFLSLIGLALFFAIFYFLANDKKIVVSKSTIIVLLFAVIVGPSIMDLLNVFFYFAYVDLYLSMAAGSILNGVFQFFFPALTALLFAELRAKRSSNNLID